MNSISSCPKCGKELGSGVTRCWAPGCDFIVPSGVSVTASSVTAPSDPTTMDAGHAVERYHPVSQTMAKISVEFLRNHQSVRQVSLRNAWIIGAIVFLVAAYVTTFATHAVFPTGYPTWAKNFLAIVAGGMVALIVAFWVYGSGLSKSEGVSVLNDADKLTVTALTNAGFNGRYSLTLAFFGLPGLFAVASACIFFMLYAMASGPLDNPQAAALVVRWAAYAQAIVFALSIITAVVLVPRTFPWSRIDVSSSAKVLYQFLSGAVYVFYLNLLPWLMMMVVFIVVMMALENAEKNQGPFNTASRVLSLVAESSERWAIKPR